MVDETNKEIIESPSNETKEGAKTTALATINTDDLQAEAISIINELVAEKDISKTKDLTYLFNVNQNKKAMVRANKLSDLLDVLTDTTIQRVTKAPDNLSNDDLNKLLKTVSELIQKSQEQINRQDEAPLIQINQQNNEVNMAEGKGLNRESRDKVKNAVMALLKDMASGNTKSVDDIIDAATEGQDNDN